MLADWFRTEPARSADADLDAFHSAWEGLAGSCQEVSAAAQWAVASGEDGTKPAALVCADVFDTPGTLTRFANANVLTSNMFKLVGRTPAPSRRIGRRMCRTPTICSPPRSLRWTMQAVRAALTAVRAPFQDALEGDTSFRRAAASRLTELGTACKAVGYSSPGSGEIDKRRHRRAEDEHG